MVWASLVSAPLDEEAIAQAQHHCENQDRIVVAHPTSVVVVGDIQALVQTALNAPMIPVQTQPVWIPSGSERAVMLYHFLGSVYTEHHRGRFADTIKLDATERTHGHRER